MRMAFLALLIAQWDPQRAEHLEQLSKLLKQHTAYLEVETKKDSHQPLTTDGHTGFGVVLKDDLVATNYFVVEDAQNVVVLGPKGKMIGRVVLADIDRRVGLIRTDVPLLEIGLRPTRPLAKKDRKPNADVFALVSTDELAGVVQGTLTDTGDTPELEGHPQTSLELTYAMPVFDADLRFVGLARTVAWDRVKNMLIPPEMITAAQTATAAAEKKAHERRKETRPWWAK